MRRTGGTFILVIGALGVLTIWAAAISIDRILMYSAARSQSRTFAPAAAGALREGKLDQAIKIADRYNKSHLARVAVAGLQEFQAHYLGTEIPDEEIEASKRAFDRAQVIVHADMESGIPQLATIAVIAPLIGLFGTVLLLLEALRAFARAHIDVHGLADRVGRSLIPLAAGLALAVLAYWMFRHFRTSLQNLDIEARNSSSELIDYLLKRASHLPRK
jgi:biopolymer transport protein ExbB/biopolymer transport protein TolQ